MGYGVSVSGGGEPIQVIECRCALTEAEFVMSNIRREVESGVKLNEIAILYRKTITGKYFQERLLAANIPFNHHGVSFYRRKMVRAVIFLLRVAANPTDDAAFEKAFVPLVEAEGASAQEAKKIVERVRVVAMMNSEDKRVPMLAQARQLLHQKVSGSLSKAMMVQGKKALKVIALMASRVKGQSANLRGLIEFAVTTSRSKDRFYTPLDKLGMAGQADGMLLNDNREPRTSVQVLLDDVESFEERELGHGGELEESAGHVTEEEKKAQLAAQATARAEALSPEEQRSRIRTFLDYLSELEEEQATKIKSDNENAVSLLTIHRSKGLEWKSVYVIKMNEGELPMSFDQAELEDKVESRQLQEERRLCFVVSEERTHNHACSCLFGARASDSHMLTATVTATCRHCPVRRSGCSCRTGSRATNEARLSSPHGTSRTSLSNCCRNRSSWEATASSPSLVRRQGLLWRIRTSRVTAISQSPSTARIVRWCLSCLPSGARPMLLARARSPACCTRSRLSRRTGWPRRMSSRSLHYAAWSRCSRPNRPRRWSTPSCTWLTRSCRR